MIFIGSDHGGYKLKEQLKQFLAIKGESVTDLGTNSTEATDFPQIAKQVAESVVTKQGRGILICRDGIGMSVAANKFAGIRAGVAWNTQVASQMRKDLDANILTLPADYINEKQAEEIVDIWLSTPFAGIDRYINRIKQIKELEK